MTRDRQETTTATAAPPATIARARRAQASLCAQLRGRAGVRGVGLTRRGDGYALRVNVLDPGVRVPSVVDGVPVEVRATGRVTPHAAPG